jgi:hypothetical protein
MTVALLVDGFNLYHSIADAVDSGTLVRKAKWLDIKKLAEVNCLPAGRLDLTVILSVSLLLTFPHRFSLE